MSCFVCFGDYLLGQCHRCTRTFCPLHLAEINTGGGICFVCQPIVARARTTAASPPPPTAADRARTHAESLAAANSFVSAMADAGNPGSVPFWDTSSISDRVYQKRIYSLKEKAKDLAGYEAAREQAFYRLLRRVHPICHGWPVHSRTVRHKTAADPTVGQVLGSRFERSSHEEWIVLSDGAEWFTCRETTARRPLAEPVADLQTVLQSFDVPGALRAIR